MKYVLASFAILAAAASAFTVPLRSSVAASRAAPIVSSEPKEAEGGELDLDLSEMFEMFDAADKGEEFDQAIKKVKKDE